MNIRHILSVVLSCSIVSTSAIASGETQSVDDSQKRIEQFLQKQPKSEDFPYRINLFTQGAIDKNRAGLRISETAKQLADDTLGLLFYYQLYDNSMRVPHWHANAVEMGTVVNGKMRVTIWEGHGKTHQFTVEKNGTWVIPQASLHALENVGAEKLTFLVTYNAPTAADRDFITAWAALPDAILARTVGLTQDEVQAIRKARVQRLSAYDPAATPEKVDVASPYANHFDKTPALYESPLGSIKRVAAYHPSMQHMGMQQTTLKPGTLRTPHWYTNSACLLYVSQGSGFFTMMNDDGKVYHAQIKAGDLISLPIGAFHTYLNTGKDDLLIYETFNTAETLQEISLLSGSQQFSSGVLEGALGLNKDTASRITKEKANNYMIKF